MEWLEKLKRKYRAWDERMQKSEVTIVEDDSEHCCAHCGTRFVGRFCPQCGLNQTRAHFTKKSLVLNFLDIWGMGNRPMWRTVKELMTRPGYMIRDYLNCHQLNYFPPFKLLVIISLLLMLLLRLLNIGPEAYFANEKPVSEINIPEFSDTLNAAIQQIVLKGRTVIHWWKTNLAYTTIIQAVFLVIVTRWAMGRKHRLSLVETFYAFMYISCQMHLLSIPYILLTRDLPDTLLPFFLPDILSLAILIVDHKQLYGFSFKQAFCRTLLAYIYFVLINMLFIFIGIIIAAVYMISVDPSILTPKV